MENNNDSGKGKGNNTALYVLLGAGVLYALYGSTNNYNNGGYHVQPGGQLPGGITNNTGAGVYVNFAGQVFNTLGQLIGQILQYTNGQTTFTGGNANPDSGNGYYMEQDGAIVWVPAVSGRRTRIGCGCDTPNFPFVPEELHQVVSPVPVSCVNISGF